MKLYSLILLNCLIIEMYAQKNVKLNLCDDISIVFTKFNDSIYISDEVTNAQYKCFLDYYKKKQKTIPYYLIIDSTQWQKIPEMHTMRYVELYHTHRAYKNYPVVNITHQAAVKFCDFLNDISKEHKFTLPNSEWWNYVNYINNTYCQDFDIGSLKGGFLTESAKKSCNNLINHLLDNVSEFTSDSTIVMGGNWYEGINSDSHKNSAPKPFIGFRIFLIKQTK